jgi:hypothetical protein
MGYTTDFTGQFKLDRPLTWDHANYLARFSGTRRMGRNATLTKERSDLIRERAGLPVGEEGAYFVGEGGYCGQGGFGGGSDSDDVINHNKSPSGQPGLWCQWVPAKENGETLRIIEDVPAIEALAGSLKEKQQASPYTHIAWDGGEKFYSYIEWLEYIISHFLEPWGYVLDGVVSWEGEDLRDIGNIEVVNNNVQGVRV